jgi:hypothetical protein
MGQVIKSTEPTAPPLCDFNFWSSSVQCHYFFHEAFSCQAHIRNDLVLAPPKVINLLIKVISPHTYWNPECMNYGYLRWRSGPCFELTVMKNVLPWLIRTINHSY